MQAGQPRPAVVAPLWGFKPKFSPNNGALRLFKKKKLSRSPVFCPPGDKADPLPPAKNAPPLRIKWSFSGQIGFAFLMEEMAIPFSLSKKKFQLGGSPELPAPAKPKRPPRNGLGPGPAGLEKPIGKNSNAPLGWWGHKLSWAQDGGNNGILQPRGGSFSF